MLANCLINQAQAVKGSEVKYYKQAARILEKLNVN